MNNKEYYNFIMIICFMFLLTSCGSQTINVKQEKDDSGITNINKDKEKELLGTGLPLKNNYKLVLTESQKKSKKEEILTRANEIPTWFSRQENRIDNNKKINLLVYGLQYDDNKEIVNWPTFLVNTSDTEIKTLKLKFLPKLKDIEIKEWLEFHLNNDEIKNFKKNKVIMIAVSGYIAKKDFNTLQKSTAADITFEIKDLEINGKKVENTNEN